jgi:hypothetical protein
MLFSTSGRVRLDTFLFLQLTRVFHFRVEIFAAFAGLKASAAVGSVVKHKCQQCLFSLDIISSFICPDFKVGIVRFIVQPHVSITTLAHRFDDKFYAALPC